MLDHKGLTSGRTAMTRPSAFPKSNTYPFAGYKNVLGTIYSGVRAANARRVLDIGCGTAVLTSRLYADGLDVTAADFFRPNAGNCAGQDAQSASRPRGYFAGAFLRCWRKKSLTPSSAPMRCTT